MSQAVAAPNTGDPFLTGGKSAKATDNSTGIVGSQSPTRRAVLGAMALAPIAAGSVASAAPALSAWASAYHEYRRLRLLMQAYYDLGPMNWVSEDYLRLKLVKGLDPAILATAAAALQQQEDQTERYYGPVRDAARALMRLPAPDLDAVAVKMGLHKDDLEGTDDHELAWTCIQSDLERLAA